MEDEVASLRSALSDRYEVQQEIGRGGMSVVYLARDVKHDRLVAVKVLRSDLSEQIGAERFHREVDIAAHLSNPHILPLFDSGESEDRLYYVMPYVDGGTLSEQIERDGRLSTDAAIEVARSIGLALAAAHEKGIVHRDIKPGNILFSGGEAVVADFGIARATEVEGAERLTRSGLSVGSPAFMSPEQAGGDPVDGRSDLYSLGCVLYTMLTGRPPFIRDTAQATIAAQIAEPAPSVRETHPEVPRAVDEIVLTALQKDPDDRFQSAMEMVEALEHPELMPQQAKERRLKRRVRNAESAIAMIVGAAVIFWLAWRAFAPAPLPAANANRVMVFPLLERGSVESGIGLDAAITIGNALNYADPLTFVDGWSWLDAASRADPSLVTSDAARDIALAQRARWFVTGTILGTADSSTVTLLLHDAVADTGIARELAAGTADFDGIADASLDATTRLLPALLEPGREFDPAVLAASRSSSPMAMLEWVQGEQAYRTSRFSEALDHYRSALQDDPDWAFAAIKAAQAASWLDVEGDDAGDGTALALARRAVANRDRLPPKYAALADGLLAYQTGASGEAVGHLERALTFDSSWAEAWMALGEVYYHLMPGWEAGLPIAEEAFLRSWEADSSFVGPLFHLTEIAVRRGDLDEARRWLDRYREARPESEFLRPAEIMLDCVALGPDGLDWRRITTAGWEDVASAAYSLSVGGMQPACAEAAFRAVLGADSVSAGWAWGSGLGLQSLFLATGRTGEAMSVIDSLIESGISGAYGLLPLNATAGYEEFRDRGAEAMAMVSGPVDELSTGMLPFVGNWAAFVRDTTTLAATVRTARRLAAENELPDDRSLAAGLEARLLVARGDTAAAIDLLEAHPPRASRTDLNWVEQASLPGERLLLAELYLASGEFDRASSVAAGFEAHPVIYQMYLPRSLKLRAVAAVAMGDAAGARVARARLADLASVGRNTE